MSCYLSLCGIRITIKIPAFPVIPFRNLLSYCHGNRYFKCLEIKILQGLLKMTAKIFFYFFF